MSKTEELNRPWLVAVWPGMGHVAVSAGYYLMSKLGMHLLAELSAEGLFDVEHIEVQGGIIHTGSPPRSRFFVWRDPEQLRDIVVFIGGRRSHRKASTFFVDALWSSPKS